MMLSEEAMAADLAALDRVLGAAGDGWFARDKSRELLEQRAREESMAVIWSTHVAVTVCGSALTFEMEWDISVGLFVVRQIRSNDDHMPQVSCVWAGGCWVPPYVCFHGFSDVALFWHLAKPLSIEQLSVALRRWNAPRFDAHFRALIMFYVYMRARYGIKPM